MEQPPITDSVGHCRERCELPFFFIGRQVAIAPRQTEKVLENSVRVAGIFWSYYSRYWVSQIVLKDTGIESRRGAWRRG